MPMTRHLLRALRLLPIAPALLTASLSACAATPEALSPLPRPVAAALRKAAIPENSLSALVAPVQAEGAVRLRHRADEAINPASVMKLVTTYAALDLLGPDFTWRTSFYTDGQVDQGALRGNLYIKGGGDPKLVLERIQQAFFTLQSQGVQVVMGDMVLDHSAFTLPSHNPAEFDGEALRPYNASPDALLVNFKAVILKFTPDAAAGVARVTSEPPLEGLAIDGQLPLSRGGCGDWRNDLKARFDDPNSIRFEGQYPRACGEREWPVAYQDPASYAARALEGLWRASGGSLTGRVRPGATPAGARLLHEAISLPLSDIITDVNQWSNNVMAQQVFLTLGQLQPQKVDAMTAPRAPLTPMRTGGWERSRDVLKRWWVTTFGIRQAQPVVDNGSGLSRSERITAESLNALLQHAARHPKGEQFVQSLSVAGLRGTAARIGRSPGSAAHGNAWLKTGTLRDVTGVAGYVNARNGQRFVVVAFVNHPNATEGRAAVEALVEWVASQPE